MDAGIELRALNHGAKSFSPHFKSTTDSSLLECEFREEETSCFSPHPCNIPTPACKFWAVHHECLLNDLLTSACINQHCLADGGGRGGRRCAALQSLLSLRHRLIRQSWLALNTLCRPADLRFTGICLPLPPERWDLKRVPPHLASPGVLSQRLQKVTHPWLATAWRLQAEISLLLFIYLFIHAFSASNSEPGNQV